MTTLGRGGSGQMSEADEAKMREEQRDRLLLRAFAPPRRFTPDERNAAQQALIAKDEANRILLQELAKLRRVARSQNPGEQELELVSKDVILQQAVRSFCASLAQYRETVEATDDALAKQLSVHSQAVCLSLGVLDNGLGSITAGTGGR